MKLWVPLAEVGGENRKTQKKSNGTLSHRPFAFGRSRSGCLQRRDEGAAGPMFPFHDKDLGELGAGAERRVDAASGPTPRRPAVDNWWAYAGVLHSVVL